MQEEIIHKCTVSWGMLVGDDTGEYVEKLINEKKKQVSLALELCGFKIVDQHFIHDCEWGTLYTWAELVENPENLWMMIGDRKVELGHFYNEDKQREFLLNKKINKL